MGSTTTDDQPKVPKEQRRIVKAKRRQRDEPIIDPETGEQMEFEDDSEEESNAQYMDEQEVVQHDSDEWEEEDEADEMEIDQKPRKGKGKKEKAQKEPEQKEVWNDAAEPLKEDEELEYDSSAYEMLHRANVEWPCLSVDVLLPERLTFPNKMPATEWFPSQMNGVLDPSKTIYDNRLKMNVHKDDKYPMSVYFCGGSQCQNKNENKIYVMKWAEMVKTQHLDDEPSDNSEDDEDDIIEKMNKKIKEPVIKHESIPHRGSVNRIRSLHGSSIVATWSEEGEVGIYNVSAAIDSLDAPEPAAEQSQGKKKKKKNQPKKNFGGCKIAQFRHKAEGYALEWSPNTFGRLASGSCDAQIYVYTAADENCSSFLKET